jgi:hypothetical protein
LRPRNELYTAIHPIPRCFIAARTTKYLNFSAAPTNCVFTDALYIFTTERWDLYAVVQCTLHEVWARKYSGALETRLRYSPSDCFETYPFPNGLWQTTRSALADLGERYHEHRRALMRQLWLGLTDIYNLFHTRDLTPDQVAKISKKSTEEAEVGYQGIVELRRLHRQLDEAIRDTYGWTDLNLGHDFHEVETFPENDRVRYTISPAARKEVLKRLLAENHRRAAAESLAIDAIASAKKKRGRKSESGDANRELFGDEQIFPWDGREDFVYALIPHLVQQRPGKQFEFYRDAALLASRPQRCATLLLDDALRGSYSQAVRGLDYLQFPDDQRIRPREIREALQRKQVIKTDARTGATTVQSITNAPALPKGLEPVLPLILKAADNLDKMQRGALERAEAEKLELTKEALALEFEQLMVA